MQLALAPLLWAEREHGVDDTFCGAECGGRQFVIVARSSDAGCLIRERSSEDVSWCDVAVHDEFAEALTALGGILDAIATSACPPDGAAVLVLPAADGLVGVVRTIGGYSRAFEPWDNIDAVAPDGNTQSTIIEALRYDIDDTDVNG